MATNELFGAPEPTTNDVNGGALETSFADGGFLQAGMAALNGFGPLARPYPEAASSVLPAEMAQSIAYGVEPNWDMTSMMQNSPDAHHMRLRAWKKGGYQYTVAPGTHLFSSLVKAMQSLDKVTVATVPLINELLERRAYDEARAITFNVGTNPNRFTDTIDESSQLATTYGADTPADLLDIWTFAGVAIEPGETNGLTNEPLWSFAVPSRGVVSMTNCFSIRVQPADFLYFITSYVANKNTVVGNEYTPQPRQIMKMRGWAGMGVPARNTNISKTDWKPNPDDADSMRMGVLKPLEWTEFKYNANAPPGSKWTTDQPLHAIADGVQKQIKLNLYEQGAIVCVGQVEGSAPRSCYDAKQLANGLQNSTVYKTLPLVSVVPLARVY